MILFDAALLVQNTRCGRVKPHEVLNNYSLITTNVGGFIKPNK